MKVDQLKDCLKPFFDYSHCFVSECGERSAIIVPLFYHVAVYTQPDINYGYDDRYCITNTEIALKAVEHYLATGEMKYWHKHHNKRIVVEDNYLYADDGGLRKPEYAIGEVAWNATELRAKHKHIDFGD